MTIKTENDLPEEITTTINGCARGSYQRHLLDGGESWSGASLQGKASEYGARYAASRENLLTAINAALPVGYRADTQLVYVDTGNGRRLCRELVVEDPEGTDYLYGRYHSGAVTLQADGLLGRMY
jgi:hypothetical protein